MAPVASGARCVCGPSRTGILDPRLQASGPCRSPRLVPISSPKAASGPRAPPRVRSAWLWFVGSVVPEAERFKFGLQFSHSVVSDSLQHHGLRLPNNGLKLLPNLRIISNFPL